MTGLTERQLTTLRALLAGRTVTPDLEGLVEAWTAILMLLAGLAAMRDNLPAWAETARRLSDGEV